MKFGIVFLLVLQTTIAGAQTCNCLDEFNFIKEHIEKNHGGFNKKIGSPEEPAYRKFTGELAKEIGQLKESRYCIAYLKKYILYLQDHHSNISGVPGQPVNENSEADIEAFLKSPAFTSTENIRIDSLFIDSITRRSKDPMEGIYQTQEGTYKVLLFKNKNQNRDYAAVIIESKTRLWAKDQVKFELKMTTDSTLQYFGYLRNHGLNYDELVVKKDQFRIPGWEKQTGDVVNRSIIPGKLIEFSVLDSQTTLLSIRSFSSSLYKTLDSVYKIVIPQIKKYRRLIIDIRNNGGGADFAYQPLMPLLYTDTIHNDVVDIYNTPGNLAAYKKFDSISVKNGNGAVFTRSIVLMEKATPYKFIPMGSGVPSISVLPVNKGYPDKIAILYNKGCASSCESLLFDALYSRKTVLVGENSGGYTGYGDVMNIQTPCGNTLSWTTTVYRDQWRYEFVGIPPQYRVPDTETDWVEYTRKLISK